MNETITKEPKMFFKVVCISEGYEYEILEEKHCGSLEEIYALFTQKFNTHKGCRWQLIPMYY